MKNAENKKAEEMMPIVMVTEEKKKKKKLDLDLLQKRTEDHPKARIEIGGRDFFCCLFIFLAFF